MRRSLSVGTAIVALGAVLVACAEGAGPGTTLASTTTTTTHSGLGGDRLPVQLPTEEYGHFRASITGDLVLEPNGCWTITLNGQKRVVVFPVGFEKSADGLAMLSPDQTRFESGAAVDGTGSPTQVVSLPDGPDGYWSNYLAFCDPTANEVVVLDEVDRAWDPNALPEAELVKLARTAEFGVSWGCGLGFTLSSEDQRVVLYLDPTDFGSAPTPPITFPDAAWSGRVVVGKNLLVNHCDDVMEYWEPESIVAASWEVTEGVLDFEAPTEVGFDACGTAGPVEASLTGAVISTPDGPLELGDLTMVNEFYGCFAG